MAKEKRLKPDPPWREVWEVGRGDFVFVDGKEWQYIEKNSAEGKKHPGSNWTIRTDKGKCDMWNAQRFAKAEDFE